MIKIVALGVILQACWLHPVYAENSDEVDHSKLKAGVPEGRDGGVLNSVDETELDDSGERDPASAHRIPGSPLPPYAQRYVRAPSHHSGPKPHQGLNFSIVGGPGSEINEGGHMLFVFGPSLAYTFPNGIEIGLEYEQTGSVPTAGADINYYIGHSFFVGVQGGLDFSVTTTEYIGPQFGYDIPLNASFLIGPEIQYLQTFKDRGGILEALLCLKHYF